MIDLDDKTTALLDAVRAVVYKYPYNREPEIEAALAAFKPEVTASPTGLADFVKVGYLHLLVAYEDDHQDAFNLSRGEIGLLVHRIYNLESALQDMISIYAALVLNHEHYRMKCPKLHRISTWEKSKAVLDWPTSRN